MQLASSEREYGRELIAEGIEERNWDKIKEAARLMGIEYSFPIERRTLEKAKRTRQTIAAALAPKPNGKPRATFAG